MQKVMVFLAGLLFPLLGALIGGHHTERWMYIYIMYGPLALTGLVFLYIKLQDSRLWLKVGLVLGFILMAVFVVLSGNFL